MSLLVLVVHGAYGRDYDPTEIPFPWAACLSDWNKGLDFKILSGPYCSNRDILQMKEKGVKMIYFITGRSEVLGHIDLSGPNGSTTSGEGYPQVTL